MTTNESKECKALALSDTMSLGKVLSESGFFSDTKTASQAIAKILAGQELGFPPLASMTGIYIVKGKIALSANLMATGIKRGGKYNYRIKRLDDTGCVLEFSEGGKPIGESSFTDADAKKAGLLSGENWQKYPRNMYFARALSNGAKWYCPDAFGMPVYAPDEMGTVADVETGEIIDIAPPAEEKPPATEKPAPAPAKAQTDDPRTKSQNGVAKAQAQNDKARLTEMATWEPKSLGELSTLAFDHLGVPQPTWMRALGIKDRSEIADYAETWQQLLGLFPLKGGANGTEA